jgi:peptide/nickel transport system substrate-binding protein
MSVRRSWQLLAALLLVILVAGCGGKQDSKQTQDTKVRVPETIGQAQASPAAGAPTPATAARVEPKGKIVYAWHVAIAPVYLDPLENAAVITPYGFQYALHDALVKHMPGKPLAPSLAESYEFAPDQKSATFKLRQGIKFHNGEPVTPEDVKFTYENYKGANARIFKDKTERVEIVDSRTVRFLFKEPFPDFMILYGSPASGAGWIVPKKYYEQVGPDAFKQKPVGAGPYKFVRQVAGTELELEAFTDYWRKTPRACYELQLATLRGWRPESRTPAT